MVIKRVRPLSFAKITGVLYGTLGAIVGAIMSLVALVGGFATGKPQGALFGAIFGVGAIVLVPVIYGGVGFLMTLLAAWLYNIAAGFVGGAEIEVQ